MFENEILKLEKGIRIEKFEVYIKRELDVRLKGERRFEINIKSNSNIEFLMFLKIFLARSRYYKPFVEFFGINYRFCPGDEEYADSKIESELIKIFSKPLGGGGKLYISYEGDDETAKGLNIGAPGPVTRLGYLMYKNGFTWFKDWYFPEGGSEGAQKLQGEKPLNRVARKRHMDTIKIEIENFFKNFNNETLPEDAEYLKEAKIRGRKILENIS